MKKLGLALGVVLLGGMALAAEGTAPTTSTSKTTLTPEQRGQLADMHEKMAACLRSDRSLPDCHDEMMKSCQSVGMHACCCVSRAWDPCFSHAFPPGDPHHAFGAFLPQRGAACPD
ncbi:MAG: hypothetical protein ACYDCL_18930, partial [Myxococcales bacterium]